MRESRTDIKWRASGKRKERVTECAGLNSRKKMACNCCYKQGGGKCCGDARAKSWQLRESSAVLEKKGTHSFKWPLEGVQASIRVLGQKSEPPKCLIIVSITENGTAMSLEEQGQLEKRRAQTRRRVAGYWMAMKRGVCVA